MIEALSSLKQIVVDQTASQAWSHLLAAESRWGKRYGQMQLRLPDVYMLLQ